MLEIAGIMSDRPLTEVNDQLEAAKDAAFTLGVSRGIDPFMTPPPVPAPVLIPSPPAPPPRPRRWNRRDVSPTRPQEAILRAGFQPQYLRKYGMIFPTW